MNLKKLFFKTNSIKKNLLISLIILTPIVVYANAGLPMIIISYPLMLIALVPIIIIESLVFYKIAHAPYKKSLLSNSVSNAISTCLGFPLAWGFLFGLEMITTGGSCGPGFDTIPKSIITVIVEAAWLCPHTGNYYWLVPIAFIISLIVSFVFSIIIEYFINRLFFKEFNKKILYKAVLISNISSYGLLIVFSIGDLIYSIISKS